MKDSKPLLTVAIPAYRRPETLEKIIKSFQQEENQNFVLLIADDSMDKSVEKMITPYLKKYSNIIYHKNKENLGFNKNVLHLYELVSTKYVWYLCDDDTIVSGCVDKILNAIKKFDFSVAVFNCSWVNPYGVLSHAGVLEDKLYTKLNQLKTYQPLMRMTFLSIVIFEKRIDVEEIKKTDFQDNIFIQITLGLLTLSNKFRYVEVADEILHRNVGYKYGEFFKFFLVDELKAVFLTKHIFDNKKFILFQKQKYFEALQLYLSQKIGIFKYNGSPSVKTLKMLYQYYGFFAILFLFFKILSLLVPTFVLKFIYLQKLKQIHGNEKALDIYNKQINRSYTDSRKTGFTSYK